MNSRRRALRSFGLSLLALTLVTAAAAQDAKRFQPREGMPGKDVVWVPTPDFMVEKMLDIGEVKESDYVIDLGSGDGRNVIAAAKRGATALGIEYNEKLVELSRELAKEAGVAGKATFVQGDMYKADISRASVMILFLLTENLNKLAPKFMSLRPGTRMVINTFRIDGWDPDYTESVRDCVAWCTVHLHIVPARVAGTWHMGKDSLTLSQDYQFVRGTLTRDGKKLSIEDGRLRGTAIRFAAGGMRYEGIVDGNRMTGAGWDATKKAR